MSRSDAVLARICGMNERPDSAVCAVVYGISTTSSESLPLAVCPFGASTPTTVNGTLRICISCADRIGAGEEVARRRSCRAPRPCASTRTSSSAKKSPDAVCQSRMTW